MSILRDFILLSWNRDHSIFTVPQQLFRRLLILITHTGSPRNRAVCATSARSETREKSGPDDGSRSEVRGFRNFEPRTSNFVSRLARFYRQSRPSRLSQESAIVAETLMDNVGYVSICLSNPHIHEPTAAIADARARGVEPLAPLRGGSPPTS